MSDLSQAGDTTRILLVIAWDHWGQCSHGQDVIRTQDVCGSYNQNRAVHPT